jgi:uncharacterized protein (TIGR01777 family)
MNNDRTVIVSGATGFIGRSVMKQLSQNGWHSLVVSREPERARAMFPAALDCIGYEGDALERALAAHGKAIRLAGHNPLTGRWNAAFKAKMWESRVDMTARFAKALALGQGGERVLVSAGGINIHPDQGEASVAENGPVGNGFVSKMLIAKESALEPAIRAGVRTVTLRIGLAFGKGGGPLAFMEQPFRRHIGGHVGSGRQYVPWLHVDDLARMFVAALEDPGWAGPYIAAAPEPERARDVAKMIGRRLGRSSWLHVPAPAARLMLGEMATLVLSSYRADCSKAEKLGFKFKYRQLHQAFDAIYGKEPQPVPVAVSQRS